MTEGTVTQETATERLPDQSLLEQLWSYGVLSPLDYHFARSLVALGGADDETVACAALASRAVQLGHVCLDLTHVQNTGAAFGLLNAASFPHKPLVMIGIAAIALVAIAAYATQLGFHERLARFGLCLILGGAFGNLIDRAFAGHVVDFVDVYWGASHFWAFNVADAAITVGAALVLLDMIGIGRQHAPHPV